MYVRFVHVVVVMGKIILTRVGQKTVCSGLLT